jgi:ferredoxin
MSKRKIIFIDHKKCNGCGKCIPNCPEGAIQIIDGKARLISDLFCDGLGACIGHCPEAAITQEEREAAPYEERKVMENIVKQGNNVIKAHLKHLKDHSQDEYLYTAIEFLNERNINIPFYDSSSSGQSASLLACPGSKMFSSELGQWPVQLMLVPVSAPYFDNAQLLIAADCVPFAYAHFHRDLLKGKILLVGCPKLDDINIYKERITGILAQNKIKSVIYAHMEVPCCFGLVAGIKEAISASGKDIPFKDITVSIKGEIKSSL